MWQPIDAVVIDQAKLGMIVGGPRVDRADETIRQDQNGQRGEESRQDAREVGDRQSQTGYRANETKD